MIKKDITREINFSKYSHRCITPCYGLLIDKTSKVIGFVYEFMSNGDLNTYLDSNKFNEVFLLITVSRIFQGIDFLQSNGLIHRDLKSLNIFIDHDNLAYISDFETIRKNDNSEGPFTNYIGSVFYSSPEQDKGEEISYPTDIYSFGLIIYFLYEGKNMNSNFIKNEKNYYSNDKGAN